MITEENLNQLYQEIIKGTKLTTKELNSYGFTGKDLKKLIEAGKLERIKIGLYQFIDLETLLELGKQSINRKEYDKAELYFKKCYELDNTNLKVLYRLFLQSIKDKKYDETIKYYENLSNSKNPYYIPDYNLYIYLLNTITELPEKYQEYAKNIQLKDVGVLVNDKRYKDAIAENRIRLAIINKSFKFALKQLNDMTTKKQDNTIYDVVLRTLIIDAIDKENLNTQKILELSKNKKYQEIINILNEKEKKQNITILEKYIIKLSETIINIKENKQIPTTNFDITDNVYEAIQRNNYELALEISINHSKKYNLDSTNNIMCILLTEVCDLIKEIKNNKNQEDIKLEEQSKPTIQLTDIITHLIQNDIDVSLENIKEYLNNKNQKEYEFLITNLIKISILEEDITYSKAILVLINLNRNNYQFDISNYIEEFYIALSQNKLEIAKVYLDIINNAKKIGQSYAFTENLEKVLEQATETVNKKILRKQKEENEEQQVEIKEDKKEIEKSIKQHETNRIQTSNYEVRDSEKEFIEEKHQKLVQEKGIILLKPMDKERRQRIYDIAQDYKDMAAFSIGKEEKKPIVLRYKTYTKEYIDIKKLISNGDMAYSNNDYNECINCYLQILAFGKPRAFIYAKLGLAYMKKRKLDKAIEYLTVATQLSKETNEVFDFTELIEKLRGNIEEAKPKFIMREKEFKRDLDNNYGIENFEEINDFIIETNLDVDSACQKLNLNEEQIIGIKLLYAKLYYSQGEYDIGDLFYQSVEKTSNKNDFIKKQLDEIRRTRKFYINRDVTIPKKLSLTLKPKK